jgi:hypothetical protein
MSQRKIRQKNQLANPSKRFLPNKTQSWTKETEPLKIHSAINADNNANNI